MPMTAVIESTELPGNSRKIDIPEALCSPLGLLLQTAVTKSNLFQTGR